MSLFFSRFFRLVIILGIVFSLGFSSNQVFAENDTPISITTIDQNLNRPFSVNDNGIGVARSQEIKMNEQAIEQLAGKLFTNKNEKQKAKFQVFSDLEFEANFETIEDTLQSGFLMKGNLDNNPDSFITLVSTDGVISANLEYQGKQYHLKSNEQDGYYFEEIDQSQFPEELDALPLEADLSESFSDQSFDVPALDGGYVIDVMVVFTATARSKAGGTSQIQNLINLAVSETNTGYQRSGITSTMRLVHTTEINYDESILSSGSGWSTALSQLTNQDGIIDNVRDLRNTYGADLVVMIVDNTTYCGIGWLMNPSYTSDNVGYSVVSRNCATGYYSFAHETGHNMGAHHDRATAGGSTAMYSYSYGYQAPDSSFRTIMAYNCGGSSCPRINNWSNPNVLYNGKPTGVSSTAPNSADNRLTLNNTAPIVSNFRSAKVTPNAPTNLFVQQVKSNNISVTFTDNSTDEQGFKVERSLNGGSWSLFTTLPANTTSFVDAQSDLCSKNFSYRVYAYNQNGNSAFSNIATTGVFLCTEPAKITDLKVYTSTSSITLDWTPDSYNTQYKVEISSDLTKSMVFDAGLDVTQIPFTISGLEKGATYILTITGTNDYGEISNGPIYATTSKYAIFLPLTTKN
ncbi:MAG TPA: M12 family metallo-peptidase [Anaerolineaceae bacterium]|nr:M12 family metallo-peptidase [Anaerolineaceae bacterium]